MTAPAHTAYAHVVRALLANGWTAQACPDDASAAALFDRLRAYPVQVERLTNGRLIEATRPHSVDARAA